MCCEINKFHCEDIICIHARNLNLTVISIAWPVYKNVSIWIFIGALIGKIFITICARKNIIN